MPTSDVQFQISGILFPHLNNINFSPPKSHKIDHLIGIDHPHLHRAIKEIRGNIGEPMARLTPLGWSCVGKTHINAKSRFNSNSRNASMFISNQQDLVSIEKTLQKFWEIDTIQPDQLYFSQEDSEILET